MSSEDRRVEHSRPGISQQATSPAVVVNSFHPTPTWLPAPIYHQTILLLHPSPFYCCLVQAWCYLQVIISKTVSKGNDICTGHVLQQQMMSRQVIGRVSQ